MQNVRCAGASVYWMKTGTREEFNRAIDTVLGGEVFVSPRITLRAVHEVVGRPAAHPKLPNLTDRELHIFSWSGAGFGTSGIARELGNRGNLSRTYQAQAGIS